MTDNLPALICFLFEDVVGKKPDYIIIIKSSIKGKALMRVSSKNLQIMSNETANYNISGILLEMFFNLWAVR
jgi:hypothetical protein